MSELLTREAAASRLGVSGSTLDNWRRKGDGPGWFKRGNRLYYPAAELDKFVAAEIAHAAKVSR